MVHRGRRSREARERRRCRRLSRFDQRTGEVINVQERFIQFEPVIKSLGFSGVDQKLFVPRCDEEKGLMFLYQGEVLVDWRGEGTVQARPDVFAG